VDFNNDDILDLVLGERNGYYNFYTGNGDGTLHFIGHPVDEFGTPIERRYNSAAYLCDWDEDGYIDFIAGGYDSESTTAGRLEVHLNTGEDITSPVWDASVIDLTPLCNRWRLTHQTYDLDLDGDKDLVFGYEMGNVWFAENIGTNSSPEFSGYIQLVSDGGPIDVYTNFLGGGRARENPTDYNSDGIPDLLVGCNEGWIYYFEGYTTAAAGEGSAPVGGFQMALSGVPTTGPFSVNLALPAATQLEIVIYDASGRAVESVRACRQAGVQSIQMDLSSNDAGVYLVTAVANGVTETAKLMKID
jgi:hypothetical protein